MGFVSGVLLSASESIVTSAERAREICSTSVLARSDSLGPVPQAKHVLSTFLFSRSVRGVPLARFRAPQGRRGGLSQPDFLIRGTRDILVTRLATERRFEFDFLI
jgi:hypothetical protein